MIYSNEMTKAARLRELIAKGCVAMPGVPNASMARQVERAGFDAVYISGAGLANCTAGLPDIGLLTLTEVRELAGYIAQGGEDSGDCRCRHRFRRRGECGADDSRIGKRRVWPVVIIEDQEFPKRCGHLAGKSLVDVEDMDGKIRAAVAAKRDKDFLIIARTDARAVENFDGAVNARKIMSKPAPMRFFRKRCKAQDEFRDFAKEVKVPLLANMTEFGKSPLLSFEELARAWLSDGDFSAERVSGFDESDARNFCAI